MAVLSVSSMGIASSIYATVSVAGYAQFGGATQGDILNCYDTNDGLAILARLALAVHIALTFPVIFNSTRANIHSLIARAEGCALPPPNATPLSTPPSNHRLAHLYQSGMSHA
jgi:amino acid permease